MFRWLSLGWLGARMKAVGRRPGAWLGVLGVGLLLVALRWNTLDLPLVRDEGEYAYAAQLLRNGRLPYEDSFLQKPPMAVYTYALAGALGPNTFWLPRVLSGVFAGVAGCLLGWMVRLEFGPGLALPAMWLVTPMLLSPGLWQFTASTEMFLVVPLLATIAVYVVGRHSVGQGEGGGVGAWFLAGLLGATTLWYKYTVLPVLALLVVVWSVVEWRAGRGGKRLLCRWCAGMAGAGIASGVILLPFLVRDGGRRLWECTVVFNRFYRASASFGAEGFWSWVGAFWADWWILFLLLGVLAVRRAKRVWFWVGMFVAAWASTGASAFGHYYVVVMPFWAALAAVAIDEVAGAAGVRMNWPRAWMRRALTAGVVVLLCLPDLPWLACGKEQLAAEKAGGGNAFIESRAVARRVAGMTSPNDFVFVAGSEPRILCYAKRFSPSRFVIMYPLMIPTPLAPSYQQEAMAELERRPPAVIVLARSPLSWLAQEQSPAEFMSYLNRLLGERYEPVGGWIVEEQGGHWQEPLAAGDREKCSLVVFRRKGPHES
jgi:hypothetical protein